MFHWNGTASGFIKIYELNHHWKYKTLVRARGKMGGKQGWAGVGRQWGGARERQTNQACLCRMVWRKKKNKTMCVYVCVDSIWRNISGAIYSVPADVPFGSCYRAKECKSKSEAAIKSWIVWEKSGRWDESPRRPAAAVALQRWFVSPLPSAAHVSRVVSLHTHI